MNPLLTKVVGLFTGGEGKLVNAIGKVADDLITSKEEKALLNIEVQKVVNTHIEEMSKQAIQETESYLKDVQSARDANVQIQNSDKASWLAKNIAYCIDAFVILVWGFLTIYLLCVMLAIVKKNDGVDYTAVTAVWGGVTAFAGTIMNFHRGSSKSSEEKTKQIKEMIKEGK